MPVINRRAALFLGLFAAASFAGAAPAPSVSAKNSGGDAARYLSARLVDDARRILRDVHLAPERAAREAAVLLQCASKLDETDPHTLKLLAEAARTCGQTGLQREALRQLITLDPGDLVAQASYLDLVASASQTVEDRLKVFQNAVDQPKLDPQVRSEMALRLAHLAEERGDRDQQKQYFERALSLNDVNVLALRGLVRLAAENPRDVPEQFRTLIALLIADPYQPDAWIQLANLAKSANLHDKAVDYFATGIDQMRLQGAQVSGETYYDLALEKAILGRRAESFLLLGDLARLPDAPLYVLIPAELLAASDVAGSGPTPTQSQPMKELLAQRIRPLLADRIKNAQGGPEAAAALADAAGVELTIMPAVSPATDEWLDQYSKMVAPGDMTLQRLRGWQLYRQGKLDEALALLRKSAPADPMSEIGVARILTDQGKKQDAAKALEDLWASNPSGLLALQVAEAARRAGAELQDTSWNRQLREITARLPQTVLSAHVQPREIALMSATIRRTNVNQGEPILMTVRITNATARALPIGPEGMVATALGLSAAMRGANGANIGIYALEDLQRSFRLEPRAMVESTVRVDQGELADILAQNPTTPAIASITAVTAPRVGPNRELVPGLGGQLISGGDIQRTAISFMNEADFNAFLQEVSASPGGPASQKQLVRIHAAGAILASLVNGSVEKLAYASGGGLTDAAARKALIGALTPQLASREALLRAVALRALAAVPADAELAAKIDALRQDPDPLVRILWAARAQQLSGDAAKAHLALLGERLKSEQDDLVKEWMTLMAEQPTAPATTVPAPH